MKRVFNLHQEEIPRRWYNVLADLGQPLPPPLDPRTKEPLDPDALKALFAAECVAQEVSTDRFIDIPEEVLEVYRLWRPTPLFRAVNLERALKTPARIYYKYEGTSPTGSHKPNTAVAQAYYNKLEGTRRLTTETGAGQWGSALSFACHVFGLRCLVYMVRVSYEQKPYRRVMMQVYGAEVIPSPSERTEAGRKILAKEPDSTGSLGIAISEAIETALNDPGTKYSLGSVLNHVLLHQTVVGEEALLQLEMAGDYPDVVVGCVGGGSNFAGLMLPFLRDARSRGRKVEFVAAEPVACPTITEGEVRYDYGDTAKMTPLLKMHTLGHEFVPPPIHAGGLRYHGMAPIVTHLVENGVVNAVALDQVDVFEGGVLFARTEGIIPAPESAHAVRVAIDIARECRETGEEKVILIGLSGHGHFDMSAYADYLAGRLAHTASL
ncbi:TrpB-like pyridoxal phosphate-dependent enzyme [Candidatus Acetothermia bacterium]|nr:MAG: TrpB-like pyridoxal phosphate-dependent enzyme [Candidatus Acetothermia bacterium]RLE35322.1 MAG: TrpB-like pyridoxal phosphate-dependent enzyme [Candidatus Acetothermia bacterium]HDC93038.1 TrpB-like pyridoxal phosphate-dependent enzyme [Candidatus Acetothermia bacterium]